MLEKLRIGKWSHQQATEEEMKAFIVKAEEMISKYGWENRTVRPYSWNENVVEFVENWKNFTGCTGSSKCITIREMNGLAEIFNAWEEHEKAPKMKIRNPKNGKVSTVEVWFAEQMIKDGYAEAVD